MSGITFGDSIEQNIELLRTLLASLPPGTRQQAKLAAVTIEKVITGLQRDQQGNPGAALGTAFAIYLYAQRFVETGKDGGGEGEKLIQLLN